jgi:hypothetical protein
MKLTDNEVQEHILNSYNEMLDESGPVKIGRLEFYPSRILRECDPIAYRCGLNDYENLLASND